MTSIISVSDLPASVRTAELVAVMVEAANAKASRVAPCLTDSPSAGLLAEAQLVLIGAVKRWVEAGSGSISQRTSTTGPFGSMEMIDTRQKPTGYALWPSEITQLQELCRSGGASTAFTVDVAPAGGSAHLPWCNLHFGAAYCSCGTDIAGVPIYESS